MTKGETVITCSAAPGAYKVGDTLRIGRRHYEVVALGRVTLTVRHLPWHTRLDRWLKRHHLPRWPFVMRSTLGMERLRSDILKDERDEAREAVKRRDRECLDLQQQVTVLMRPRPPTNSEQGFDADA